MTKNDEYYTQGPYLQYINSEIRQEVCFSRLILGDEIFHKKIFIYIQPSYKEVTLEMKLELLKQLSETFGGIIYDNEEKLFKITSGNITFQPQDFLKVEIDIDNIKNEFKENKILVYKFIYTTIRYLFEDIFVELFLEAYINYKKEDNKHDLISNLFFVHFNKKFLYKKSYGVGYLHKFSGGHALLYKRELEEGEIDTKILFDPKIFSQKLNQNNNHLQTFIMNYMPKLNIKENESISN